MRAAKTTTGAVMRPILANNGRDVIGRASTAKGAARAIRRLLAIHPRMTLRVWDRPAHIVEINGGSSGWMFSISYDG